MKNRAYLLITILLVLFTFSLSEAGSVKIPAKNDSSVGQQFFRPNPKGDGTTESFSRLPKQDTTQTPGRKKGDRVGSVTIIR